MEPQHSLEHTKGYCVANDLCGKRFGGLPLTDELTNPIVDSTTLVQLTKGFADRTVEKSGSTEQSNFWYYRR